MTPITFTVLGTPSPQGSKTAVVIKGRAVLLDGRRGPARARHSDWRRAIAEAAQTVQQRTPMAPLQGPVSVVLEFAFLKPKSTKKGKIWVDVRPDADKLARAALDSLSGILLGDDSQVAELIVRKRYVSDRPSGCTVTLVSLPATDSESFATKTVAIRRATH